MRDTILIAIAGLIFMFATGVAKADTVKTKDEWKKIYADAGCNDKKGIFATKICETKVFQRTNWQSGKEQLTGFFNKLDLN